MKEIVKMLVVLTLICGFCSAMLSMVRSATRERITEQVLLNVQGPAVARALAGSTNDLIRDRREIVVNNEKIIVFVGKKGETIWAYAYETSGKGFGGDIGVITGFSMTDGVLTGIGVTTHKETPGLGSRVAEESFTGNFRNRPVSDKFLVKADGGAIDAITGASVSSRGVCAAVTESVKRSKNVLDRIKAR
jgi:electron transport complex protein RnfG